MDSLRSIGTNEKIRVLFAGFGSLGLCLLRALLKSPEVATIVAVMPASNVKRYRFLEEHPAEIELLRLAKENEIRILNAPSINSSQFLAEFDELEPHALQIGSWSEIIKPPTLLYLRGVPIINCHGSMLPKYRGACPCLATIFNGDRQTGMTIHLIDEGIDTGDILLQQKVDVEPSETAMELETRISLKFGEAIVPLLLDMKAGEIVARKQTGDVSYVPSQQPEWGWIPWEKSPKVIDQRIRALSGVLPLATSLNDVVLGFERGRVVSKIELQDYEKTIVQRRFLRQQGAGVVLSVGSDTIIVSTCDSDYFVELDLSALVATGKQPPIFRPGDRFFSISCDCILKSA